MTHGAGTPERDVHHDSNAKGKHVTAPTDPSLSFRSRTEQPRATSDGLGPLLVATGDVTGGEFGLFEVDITPGGRAGAHYHTGFTESFYVLEGSVALTLGDEVVIAGSGDFAFVPRHGVHGFANASEDEPARMLILFTPGVAREEYFRELIELHVNDPDPTPEQIDAVAARHDQVNLRDRDGFLAPGS